MNFLQHFEKGISFRLLLSVFLAFVAVAVFLLNRPTLEKPSENARGNVAPALANVDREIDSVLVKFGIERGWIHKRTITFADGRDSRVERRVTIPPGIPSVQLNVALNAMARRYDGRAVATENLRDGSVTIHIEVEKRIVQTIILIVKKDLKLGGKRVGQPRV